MFVILLLISFILFLIFHLDYVESKEGFDLAVPTCSNDSSVGSYIPGCHATVEQDDYLSYSDYYNSDDYILKTKNK